MPHVVTVPPAFLLSPGGRLRITPLPAATDNLVWIVEDLETGTVAAVDGPDATAVEAWEATHDQKVTVVLTTHTHGDHIGLHQALAQAGRLDGIHVVGSAAPKNPIPGLDQAVVDGDRIQLGATEGTVLRVDGHQNGHVAYLIDGALFCGDTLFAGGCGYLFDGPAEAMFASLMRLAALPDETLVCCAHEYTQDNLHFARSVEPSNEALAERVADVGATRAVGRCTVPSTMGLERATNPFLRPGSPEIRAKVGCAAGVSHADVFAATRSLKDTGAYKAS